MVNLYQVLAPQVYQGSLERVVRRLFPNYNILVNVKKEVSIKYKRGHLELDIWIPSIKLGFEFQDSHHYISTWHANLPMRILNNKDVQKREAMLKREETLIYIPFWWNDSSSSIISEIHFHRPDLLQEYPLHAGDIPLNHPVVFTGLPDVGELMLASFTNYFSTTISEEYQWWMGEKYDGTRVCWNPRQHMLYSRYAVPLDIPPVLLSTFASMFLDGEIWFGRGHFQESQRIFAISLESITWDSCRVVIFDAPGCDHQDLPFEQRYALIMSHLHSWNPFIIIAFRMACRSSQMLDVIAQKIIWEDGEGLIARRKSSVYENGRSESLIKIKAAREDREALVLNVNDEIFCLQMPNGSSTFQISRENIKSDVHPKRGDVVTFSCETYSTKGNPVNPQVFRTRKDVTWESVLLEYAESSETRGNTRSFENGSRTDKSTYQFHLHDKKRAARKLMEEWAERLQFDPLIPANWYSMPVHVFKNQKGGRAIYVRYNNSMIRALTDLFPEVNFISSKFVNNQELWNKMENRRKFFIDFANKRGFDPFVASSWYTLTLEHLKPFKGAKTILDLYGGSASKAVKHVFPELNIQLHQFISAPHNHWGDKTNRRRHYEEFARSQGFDPLVPANWDKVSVTDFLKFAKGSQRVWRIDGSIRQAITNLFPEINYSLEPSFVPKYHWTLLENKRKAFLSLAATLGFDPLIAANWYTVRRKEFLSSKIYGLLYQYGSNPYKAIADVFPELEFDRSKFVGDRNGSKFDQEFRAKRNLFENFAAGNGFDPLVSANWYSAINSDASLKGATTTKEVVKDLLKAFPDIEIDELRLSTAAGDLWKTKPARRRTLEKLAGRMGFNPIILKNWLNPEVIDQVSPLLSRFYNNNVVHAVHDLFPETYRGKPVPRRTNKKSIWTS